MAWRSHRFLGIGLLVVACASAPPREAARALAAAGDVEALVEWVRVKAPPRADGDARLALVARHTAAAAELVGLGDRAVPALARALAEEPSPSLAAVLAEIGTPLAAAALLTALDGAAPAARVGLVDALARMPAPTARARLMSLVRDPIGPIRAAALTGLGHAHDDGVYSSTVARAMSLGLGDPAPAVRLASCRAVAGRWGEGLEDALTLALAHDDDELTRCAVAGLLRMGGVGLLALEGAPPVGPRRARAVFDGFVDAGPVGLEAAYRRVLGGPRRVLLGGVVPGGIDVRDAARRAGDCPIEALSELGGLGGPARVDDVLADAASCPDLLRFTVLSTLGPALDEPKVALPTLTALSAACRREVGTVEVDPEVFGEERALAERRAARVRALGERCRAFGVPFLARAMGSPAPRVRLFAVRVAADPSFGLTAEVRTRCRDVAPEVRRAAAIALEAHGTKCPGVEERPEPMEVGVGE